MPPPGEGHMLREACNLVHMIPYKKGKRPRKGMYFGMAQNQPLVSAVRIKKDLCFLMGGGFGITS